MEGTRGAADGRRSRACWLAVLVLALLGVLGIGWGGPETEALAQSSTDWVDVVFPDRQHDFGTVARGSVLRHRFRIMNRTNQEVRITGWRPKCGCTDIAIGAKVIPPGAQTTIEAVFDTSKFRGEKASGLTLSIDRPSPRTIEYELTSFIQDELIVEPGVIDFGEVKRDGVAQRMITIDYLGGQRDWRVVKMSHSSRFLTAELRQVTDSDSRGLRYQLVARLDPGDLPNGNFRDEITLVSNDRKYQRIPISVAARVVPDVTVTPAVLNLGSIKAGEATVRTVLVKAPEPFRVMGARAVEGSIAVEGDPPASSKPLHQLRVTIQAPELAGAHHAILEIRTDRPNEPPARLTAFATVVP